jgi:predicted phosphodiesterase
MKIALFSDVHGHLRILLHMIRNWQIANSSYFDAALSAGDLGCFPDPTKFDKASRRWIERDPEEAGFSAYFTNPQPAVEKLFVQEYGPFSDVRCPILFVPGNHEDYDYLRRASGQQSADGAPNNTFPVDCYRRVHCVRNGAVVAFNRNGACLRIGGLWGIENARHNAPYKIELSSIRRLQEAGAQAFDLLLTHDAPAEAYPNGGSTLVTRVIKTCRPIIHLFGHVHPINDRHEFSVPHSGTASLVFKDVSFGREGGEGLMGAMGVLEWNDSESQVTIVQDDWLKRMYPRTWEQILPDCRVEAGEAISQLG